MCVPKPQSRNELFIEFVTFIRSYLYNLLYLFTINYTDMKDKILLKISLPAIMLVLHEHMHILIKHSMLKTVRICKHQTAIPLKKKTWLCQDITVHWLLWTLNTTQALLLKVDKFNPVFDEICSRSKSFYELFFLRTYVLSMIGCDSSLS